MVAAVELAIIIVVVGVCLIQDEWIFVKHVGVGLVAAHMLKESDVVFYLRLSTLEILRLPP